MRRQKPGRSAKSFGKSPGKPTGPTGERLIGFPSVYEALRAGRRKVLALQIGLPEGADRERAEMLRALAAKKNVRLEAARESKSQAEEGSWVSALVGAYPYIGEEHLVADLDKEHVLLACDQVQDPQNLGSILRSFHAFGGYKVLLSSDRSAGVTPTVTRASAGAAEHLQIAQVGNLARSLEALKKRGAWVAVTVARGGQTPAGVTHRPLILVLGNERTGIRQSILGCGDLHLSIPIREDFDSLNVSASAAILFHEILGVKAAFSGPSVTLAR